MALAGCPQQPLHLRPLKALHIMFYLIMLHLGQTRAAVDGTPSQIPTFTCDLHIRVKVTQNTSQYPLHHVIYASTKFEVAMYTSLGV